ncbi:hypothetical protein F4805DRAFT_476235 [Annulohypoxylon moriforme]|nr:hypothetical protein F4805DRAFT_476235 [Annulohypoxylon moriforme]
MELVAPMSLNLLQDSTWRSSRIDDICSDHLEVPENEITTKNPDRSHELRIAFFKQEVAVICRVITSQLEFTDGHDAPSEARIGRSDPLGRGNVGEGAREFEKPRQTERDRDPTKGGWTPHTWIAQTPTKLAILINKGAYHVWPRCSSIRSEIRMSSPGKLASTNPASFRELLGRECRSWLERRDKEFLELDVEVSRSGLYERQHNQSNRRSVKSSGLPLSPCSPSHFCHRCTISSVFEMKSNDVLDADPGRWMYWAAALLRRSR